MNLEQAINTPSKISRRGFVLAAPIMLLSVACQREPDLIEPSEIGEWKFWGTQKDGEVNFRTGMYSFDIRKRSLLVQRKYPLEILIKLKDFRTLFAIETLSTEKMRILGATAEGLTAREYKSQWSHDVPKPDLTVSHTVWAYWKDLEFNKMLWDGQTIVNR